MRVLPAFLIGTQLPALIKYMIWKCKLRIIESIYKENNTNIISRDSLKHKQKKR